MYTVAFSRESAGSRVSPRALALAGVALLDLLALVSCGPSSTKSGRPDPEKLVSKASLAVAGAWRPGAWNEVQVFLSGSTADLAGEIIARCESPASPPSRRPFELPKSSTRRFSIPVLVPPSYDASQKILVRVETPGFTRDLSAILPRIDPDLEARVLWVREAGTASGELQPLAGRLAARAFGPIEESEPKKQRVAMHPVEPRSLPSLPDGLAPFALVVLHETALRGADARTIEALRLWVESGGVLVAFPGPEWSAPLPEKVAELLGVESAGTAGTASDAPPGTVPPGARGTWRALTPRSGTVMRFDGLVLETRQGSGFVNVLGFTPETIEPASFDAAPRLEQALAVSLRRGKIATDKPVAEISDFGLRSLALDFLANRTGFEPPGRGVVALAMGIYIFSGFLLPYWIFGRRRREWTYLLIVVAAALGVVLVHRVGVLSLLQETRSDELALVRLAPSSTRGPATVFVARTAPGYRETQVVASRTVDPRAVRVMPVRPASGNGFDFNGFAGGTLHFGADLAPQPLSLDLYPSEPAFARVDAVADLDRVIEFRLREKLGSTMLEIKNESDATFTAIWVGPATNLRHGPTIRPQETVEIGSPRSRNPDARDGWWSLSRADLRSPAMELVGRLTSDDFLERRDGSWNAPGSPQWNFGVQPSRPKLRWPRPSLVLVSTGAPVHVLDIRSDADVHDGVAILVIDWPEETP